MKTLLFCVALLASLTIFADAPVALQDAIKQGLVTASITGQGGFTGKVLAIEVTNSQAKYVTINIPIGLQFQSEDSTIQDLIITEDKQLVLAARGTKKLVVNAMCIQPSNGSPYLNSTFMAGAIAGDTLLKLVRYIAEKQYQNELGQSAVWTLIRGEGLQNVYGPDPTKLQDMVQFMTKLTAQPTPWYNVQKTSPPPGRVFVPEPSVLVGIYTFHLEKKGFANLSVYDSTGKEVFLFLEHFEVLPGDNRLKFKLTVKGYKKGKYYARLFLDGELKEEKMFEI